MPIPEFIANLRSIVGPWPLLLVAATGVVLRRRHDQHEVILVKLADGYWTPPAGIVEPGEQPHQAAVREVYEEAGVTCRVRRLVWAYTGPLVTFSNGDQAQHVELVFRCDFVSGQLHPDHEETFEARWWPLSALPKMHEQHRARVMTVANSGGRRPRLGTDTW